MARDRKEGELYDAYYFATGCGRPYQRDEEWLGFFGAIADRIVSDIAPRTVLDAGCAMGFLVEALRERGVDAYGLDISEYAIERVHESIRDYCWVGSVTEPFPQSYDLIVCIEVLEHLQPDQAQAALANLCKHTDDILFSSTPFDYKEATHFNVRPPEYWAEAFARHGFFRDLDFDPSFITSWAARFRQGEKSLIRLVGQYERSFWQLWKQNSDLRKMALDMKKQLASHEEAVRELTRLSAENRHRAEDLSAQLEGILDSRSWRFMEKVQRLRLFIAPHGSRREQLFFARGDDESLQ